MTKQDEIKQGIADFLWEIYKRRVWAYRHPNREEFLKVTATNELIECLHSQGVVVKVDRDMEFLDDIGIYPQSVVGGDNPYKERSPYQNGWNAAVLEITKQWAKEAKDFKAVEPLRR